MEKRVISKEEFEDMSLSEIRNVLEEETEFKEFETAIREIGTLVNRNPLYKESWQLLKKRLDRSLIQIIIE